MENQNNPANNNADDNKNKNDDEKKNDDKNKKEKKKNNFVVVQFKKSYTPYLKGEKAGLDKDEVMKLIKKGICEKV